jgi:hypothetical protein
MNRKIDVKTEMRKLTDNKPVQAVAGAGVLASQALRDLPGLLARWGTENPMTALPSRATGYAHAAQSRATSYAQTAQSRTTGYAHTAQARANGYVHTAQARANGYVHTAQARAGEYVRSARTRAADGYDTLAARGKKALNGQPHTAEAKSAHAKSTQATGTTAKHTPSRSGAVGQGKTASKGKTTPRTTSH